MKPALFAALLAGASGLAAVRAAGPQDAPASPSVPAAVSAPAPAPILHAEEVHLRNLRQLTFDGENAEGYWSPAGRSIVFQRRAKDIPCDQEFVMDLATGAYHRVSNGRGKTTCGFFMKGGKRIVFASTHLASPDCPPPPDYSRGYVWFMYSGYELFTVGIDGKGLRRLTDSPGYDAEATLSPDGNTIVFTSMRDGDLEIYTMGADGKSVRRLTHEAGYDGGPVFSPDGRRIVYRRDAPSDEAALRRYRDLLASGQYAPGVLEIWVMDADGSNKRQVTRLGAASFAPAFLPDGRRIIFASNHPEPRGRNFDLFVINEDGSGLERVTTDPTFDGFPLFSRDGRRLVFASNRGARARGETNLFVADWVER